MVDFELTFEDPPEAALLRQGGPGKFVEFAIALREHPGKWALLPGERTEKTAQQTAALIRRGKVKGFKVVGEYETAHDGVKVFVKFIPPDERKQSDDTAGEGSDEDPEPTPVDDDDHIPRDASLAPLVRAWARNNGFNVPDKGRMPDAVYDAYIKATSGPRGHLQRVRRPAERDDSTAAER